MDSPDKDYTSRVKYTSTVDVSVKSDHLMFHTLTQILTEYNKEEWAC